MIKNGSVLTSLAALPGIVACGFALADPALQEDQASRLAPHDREAYVRQLVARQEAERLQTIQDDVTADVTPPVLTKFSASTTLDVSKAAAPFRIVINASDDISGFQSLSAYATGPSGQTIYAQFNPGYPATSVSGFGGFSNLSRVLEPGMWKFTFAYAYDVAGNYVYVDEDDLAALGNTTFKVVNNSGYDLVKPLLTGGKIQTPSVSLSSHPPATTKDPYVGVKLNLTDAGTTTLAGVRYAYAYFCQLADPDKCIYAYGSTNATGLAAVTLSAAVQVSTARGNVPGDYELEVVYVYDYAGNSNYLQSTKFGGTTDFSTMFPTTVIKLKP